MTTEAAPKKAPRTKPVSRAYVLTTPDGNEVLVTLKDMRVANQNDLLRALSGDLTRGTVS